MLASLRIKKKIIFKYTEKIVEPVGILKKTLKQKIGKNC